MAGVLCLLCELKLNIFVKFSMEVFVVNAFGILVLSLNCRLGAILAVHC